MTDIVKDMVTLTTIPEKTIKKFFKKMNFCICEAVEETLLAEEQIAEINVGIGTLYIKVAAGDIKYHFEPNELLATGVIETVKKGKNILEDVLNEALVTKFIEVYKDLC